MCQKPDAPLHPGKGDSLLLNNNLLALYKWGVVSTVIGKYNVISKMIMQNLGIDPLVPLFARLTPRFRMAIFSLALLLPHL